MPLSRSSITVADGSITSAKLAAGAVTTAKLGAVSSTSTYVGMTVCVKFSYTANGTPANSDDITLDYGAAGLPSSTTWEKYDALLHTESGNAASATAQIFTASGGGGSAVTTSLSAANANLVRDAKSAVVSGITSSTQHFMRRTGGSAPSGTVGHIRVYLVRTA